MKLQLPGNQWVQRNEIERNRALEQADALNHKRNQDVEIGDGRLIFEDDTTGTRYELSIDNGCVKITEVGGNEVSASAEVKQAEAVVFSTYGDTVSVAAKKKNLNKFGTNSTVGTAFETVAQFQGTTANESFVSTNLIDAVISSSASDTMTLTIEGHTIDGSGNLTFVTQDVAVTGQTSATLTTPLARATRAFVKNSGTFNSPQAAAVGTIYIYDNTDGDTGSGVPTTAAATKLLIAPTFTQSEKCATSVSSTDYWFITDFEAGIGNASGAADRVTFQLQFRDVANGGVWRPIGRDITVTVGQNGVSFKFSPLGIIPKNHDVRVQARANASTAEVFAEIQGVLALVQ